jgi:bifunctional UDP-N-acetylglucosamine pyrophosphorylase/glucosamine-1-phosphate N-acetyltransferase/UDP-N-acetylglucosamine pyrophosphorylase
MADPVAIVLAAGAGVRMNSDLPKVVHLACGRPLVGWVVEALRQASVRRILVVVGYRGELVRAALATEPGVEFVEQAQRLGTGHAVQVCREALAQHDGPVVVVTGDSPLIRPASLRSLLDEYQRSHAACLLGTLHKPDPTGLGRIVRDSAGKFLAIVEQKDATDEQRRITEVNMSTYVFEGRELFRALGQLRNENRQGEYYLTDVPGILLGEGKDVRALAVLQPCEALSVNTPEELRAVEAEMRRMGW